MIQTGVIKTKRADYFKSILQAEGDSIYEVTTTMSGRVNLYAKTGSDYSGNVKVWKTGRTPSHWVLA